MADAKVNLKTSADLAALLTAGKSFATLTAQEQAAEKQALALAQSMARLDASLKQPAAGAERLKQALANATYIDPAQGVAALNQITRLEQQAATEADKAARAMKGLGTNNGLQVLPRTLAGLSGSAAQVATGFLTIQAVERGFQFVKTGAEVADVTTSFTNLSKAAGTTGDKLLSSLRAASNSTITDAALIKSANLGLLLTQGRIAKDLPALTQIAQASAKATGQSVDFVFESLVKGISRGSAKIIDNAGITLDGEKAYADYAKSIGKTADELTKAEQQQAVLNAVVQEGNQIVKDAGINSEDASVKIAAAETAAKNLLTALAAKIAPTAGTIAGGFANLLNTGNVAPGATAGRDQAQANAVASATSFEDYAARVQAANAQVEAVLSKDPVAALFLRQQVTLEQLNPVQLAYAQSLIQTGTASADAVQKARALADVSDLLVRQTQGQDAAFQALIPKMAQVSSVSTDDASQVIALNAAFLQGSVSADQVNTVLTALIAAQEAQRQAAFQEERENRNLTRTFEAIVPAANAAADAIAGVNRAPLKHISDTSDGSIGGGVSGLGDKFTRGFDAVARAQADADRKAEQLAGVQFDNRLKKAKDNAAKIALLRQREAQTADPIERARIEGQIIDLQNQKVSGLSKELNLRESIYDSTNRQIDAQLELTKLQIDNERSTAKENAERIRLQRALDSGRQSAERQDAIRLRLREIDNDQAIRAQKIAETSATAGGTISASGKLLPGNGKAPVATAPVSAVGGTPILAPAPQSAPLIPASVVVNISLSIANGKLTGAQSSGGTLNILAGSAAQTFASGG